MEYAVGKTGRIIAARLFEGEDLFESVHEITIIEIEGLNARRKPDEKTGFNLLRLE
ncbi:MAG: hypothetical protein JSW59_11580 [Phycisphaerales bacterium]|nr:MAG: hypothetical protein JSW59_11580 [Phycisphaerales bacterium]